MAKSFKSLKGQLLLDSGQLQGSFFNRAVVLICQHDPDGAFGLVVNRLTETTLGEAMVAQLPEVLRRESLWVGGPVQTNALSVLLSDSYLPEANVMPGLHLEHSLDCLMEFGEGLSPTRKIKLFAGYSGWSPGQLDDEMRRKAWLTHPASLDLVFCAKPQDLWRDILRLKGWEYRLLADSPEDLASN